MGVWVPTHDGASADSQRMEAAGEHISNVSFHFAGFKLFVLL